MRVLVTGGTGFLGQHLVRRLLHHGHDVRAMGRNDLLLDYLAAHGADTFRGDIRNPEDVEAACERIQAVFHVAALSAAWGKAEDFQSINVDGTQNVVDACRNRRVDRLIHISSPSVTFTGEDVINATEAEPYASTYLANYSLSKKLAEEVIHKAAQKGLATVILRPKAIFGPGDTSLLPKLLAAAKKNRLPQIGSGENRVDMTYVDNVVHAMLLALDREDCLGKTYTITNDEHVALWPLIRTILKRLNLNDQLRKLPYRVVYLLAMGMELRARLFGGEPLLTRYTTAILGRTQTYDLTAAKRDLGYAPVVSIAEGVERTLAALQEVRS